MAQNNDFAFVFQGGVPFNLTAQEKIFIDTAPYEAAKKNMKFSRQLTSVSTGSSGDSLAGDVTKCMTLILDKTGGKLSTMGSCCIVGTSNGCSLALALAAELKIRGAPKLSYVGCCDVTIIPFGRDPSITNIGDLMPNDAPEFKKLTSRPIPKRDNPSMADEDPPVISLDSPIDAKNKRNFFERLGNRAKFVSRPPRAILPGWWWTSNMAFNEVHGEIKGFINEPPFIVSGASDFLLHNALCTGAAFKLMMNEASEALAELSE